MKIVEIFKSIEGEGKRAGLPATFIRLYGCNLNCSYCDTRYGCEGNNYTDMYIDDIVNKVKSLGLKTVTITGGEPLIHKDIELLIDELILAGCEINIETNGSVDISKLPDEVFVTMDYKCPYSNMQSHMLGSNFDHLRSDKDVVKFVVGNIADLDTAKQVIRERSLQDKCQVFISPVFGSIEPSDIVEYILSNDLNNVKVQLQLHKIIWDPEKRGV